MKYIEVTIRLNRCAIEPALAALDMIGIDDAEVRDPHDAEEIMADKETYEWDYVDAKVAEDIGKTPEIHIYHSFSEAADCPQPEFTPEAVFASGLGPDAGSDAAFDRNDGSRVSLDAEFVQNIKTSMEKLKRDFDGGLFGDGTDPGDLSVEWEIGDDSAWKDKWKEYFKPSHISDRIVVKPTWEEYEPADGEIVIEIDPGMAFGTGTHETTSMCMRGLEKYVRPGMSVLDAGCGSGILSIAAAKLGASDVLGVDIDEEAVRVSGENFLLNGTDDVCRAVKGDVTRGVRYPGAGAGAETEADSAEEGGAGAGSTEAGAEADSAGAGSTEAGAEADSAGAGADNAGAGTGAGSDKGEIYQADIVAANLMAELLCMISKGLADHLKKGGVLISSGILNEKEEMIREAYGRAGLMIKEVMHDGEWCCVIAEK